MKAKGIYSYLKPFDGKNKYIEKITMSGFIYKKG
jgi:hypothetical protein